MSAKIIKTFIKKSARTVTHAFCSFIKNDCYIKASTLTFYALQSSIPTLALLLGIAKGFGFDGYLEDLLTLASQEQRDIMASAIQIALSSIQFVSHGVVVGVGVLLLIWANTNLLGYTEHTLNDIWKIRLHRSIYRKLSDYLAITIIGPLIFIASGSLTLYLKTEIKHLEVYQFHETVSYIINIIFKMVPFFLSWLLFFLIYFLIPNARITFSSLVIASLFAGTLFQLWQIVFIMLQIKVFSYSIVYGAFAVFPLFLIWLQFSWIILLAGAEIGSSFEDVLLYDKDESEAKIQKINSEELGFLVLYHCFQAFYTSKTPLTELQLAKILNIHVDEIRVMLELFTSNKVLAKVLVNNVEDDEGYTPLTDPDQFTVKQISDLIKKRNDIELLIEETLPLKKISAVLKELDLSMQQSASNTRFTAILNMAGSDQKRGKL